MSQFFELALSGLMLGCIYGLIAMGFVIVFKATNVVNFAHASVVMLGALLVAKWHGSLGFFGAIAAAAIVCAAFGALLDVVFVRPLRRRGCLQAQRSRIERSGILRPRRESHIFIIMTLNGEHRAIGDAVFILTGRSKQYRLDRLRFVEVLKNWFAL